MKNAAMILDTASVPQYVKEIVPRLELLTGSGYEHFISGGYSPYDCPYGFMFKLYGKNNVGGEIGFQKDAERLVKWARSWGTDAQIVQTVGWWDHPRYRNRTGRAARQAAWKDRFRNYHIVLITDPVLYRFEKDNFYRSEKG